MKVHELIKELKNLDQDLEVITGVFNKHTETYGVIDYISKFNPFTDLFGTPGKTDSRIPDKECAYLGSEFPYKHGLGFDDINTPIELINGLDGDKDLIWKLNNFNNRVNCWWKVGDGWDIKYYSDSKQLRVDNHIDHRTVFINSPGIEDLRNAIKLCNINLTIKS